MDTNKAQVSSRLRQVSPMQRTSLCRVCPEGVLEEDTNGKPKVADTAGCTVCGVCVDLCPQKAIAVCRGQKPEPR
jgi:NAD-dependent dihydropyrimidine dehydrogenase PreA subunit